MMKRATTTSNNRSYRSLKATKVRSAEGRTAPTDARAQMARKVKDAYFPTKKAT